MAAENRPSPFQSIQPGDVIRRSGGDAKFVMELRVTAVDNQFIYSGPKATGWKFDRLTGIEVDDDLHWGPGYGVVGTFLLPPERTLL